jgi:3-methyladenine DNA glycosylase Tag
MHFKFTHSNNQTNTPNAFILQEFILFLVIIFCNFLWVKIIKYNKFKSFSDLPANTKLSDKISIDLKKQGMNFVGSTIIYAYMQSIGIVNDHEISCFKHVRK